MDVWEMVGLWHYPIPGFFLLAQFGLGILVALVNLVNNSVFLCLSGEDEHSSNDNSSPGGNLWLIDCHFSYLLRWLILLFKAIAVLLCSLCILLVAIGICNQLVLLVFLDFFLWSFKCKAGWFGCFIDFLADWLVKFYDRLTALLAC